MMRIAGELNVEQPQSIDLKTAGTVKRIIMIRHGQASFGQANYDQLSELGYQQSQLLGQFLNKLQAQVSAVSGTLKRQQQTCQACCDEAAIVSNYWQADPRWNEFDHRGVIQTFDSALNSPQAIREYLMQQPRPHEGLKQLMSEAIEHWRTDQHNNDCDIETWSQFHQRVHQAFEAASKRMNFGDTLLVFTSGGVISSLIHRFSDLCDSHFLHTCWQLINTGLTEFYISQNSVEISSQNEHPWLVHYPHFKTYK